MKKKKATPKTNRLRKAKTLEQIRSMAGFLKGDGSVLEELMKEKVREKKL